MAVQLAPAKRRLALARWVFRGALLMAVGGAIAACRPSPPPQMESPAPAETTRPEPPQSNPSTEPTPAASADTLAAATLPSALVNDWQPLSNVLLAFGTMTITPDQVQWGSGQISSYQLVSTEGGYLLELETNPSFYDTQNQYIKLIPQADASGVANSIEVAFYTNASQLQGDDYIMYGSYFAD